MKFYKTFLLSILFLSSVTAKEVRIYTERHYPADKAIFAKFTEETGIDVKVVKAGANELIARLKSEKQSPQADLYVAVDAAALGRASSAGLLEKIEDTALLSPILDGIVPADNTWIPLTMRARVIVYSKDRVKADDAPQTYADLADPKWRGNILIRSSSSHYNQSLLASILADDGEAKAMAWADGVKKNLARKPQGGDRDQVRAVALGLGDIAVTNSYYLGLLEKSDDAKDRAARAAVGVIFPNQDALGTHVNISGAGIIKGSSNQKEALQLLKFITSPENQALYQKLTSEFSVVKGVEHEPLQKSWGDFKPDFISLHKLQGHHEKAVKIFDMVGWQ